MKDIQVSYTVGNEIKQLRIKFMSNGVGQIMIGNWYHGQAVSAQDQWQVYLNDKSELKNSDDIQNLVQILNEEATSRR